MQITTNINRFKCGICQWRMSLSIPGKIAMMFGMAAMTGLLAQVRIPLPFTPVPMTGQVMAVLLAGVIMGKWWGGGSMALYAGLGIAGIPWFTGFTSGLGATGGYILGFIPAALFLGHFVDAHIQSRKFMPLIGLMLVATLLYYVPGVIWLGFWLNSSGAAGTGLSGLLALGVAPFIVVDIIKAIIAGLIAFTIMPGSDKSA